MVEAQVSAWLLTLFLFEFAIGAFLIFAARGVPWWRRAMMAPVSLFCFFFGAAIMMDAIRGNLATFEPFEPKLLLILFFLINVFAFRLFHYLKNREDGFSFFGTIGRGIGCIVIAWASFVALLVGIAVLMGLAEWLGN